MIWEQLDAILISQEKLTRTMTELRDDMAPVINGMRCPTHLLGSGVLAGETGPTATRRFWDSFDGPWGDSG
eukprot:CAMPEP_0179352986 /NCGR_PEP_ID=MMETSP0797-20121207/76090_1 /TAXON_ID=47934 /ORGANISM="Dinophysis acuminata, Strain DAEP01" /LENGTH=70 /DNA_ID=CAMNT_0021068019 /DNA_START=1 /DNA_END=210 /DNA_ORIENTATION=+